jgi:hypothetical protein
VRNTVQHCTIRLEAACNINPVRTEGYTTSNSGTRDVKRASQGLHTHLSEPGHCQAGTLGKRFPPKANMHLLVATLPQQHSNRWGLLHKRCVYSSTNFGPQMLPAEPSVPLIT